jgi:hypothetical protein
VTGNSRLGRALSLVRLGFSAQTKLYTFVRCLDLWLLKAPQNFNQMGFKIFIFFSLAKAQLHQTLYFNSLFYFLIYFYYFVFIYLFFFTIPKIPHFPIFLLPFPLFSIVYSPPLPPSFFLPILFLIPDRRPISCMHQVLSPQIHPLGKDSDQVSYTLILFHFLIISLFYIWVYMKGF